MEPERTTGDYETRSSTRPIWMRGLFMLLLLLAFGIGQGLLWVTAIVQFLWLLIGGESNAFLARFGKSLGLWLSETAQFVTCVTETKPFPWSAWPSAD